MTDDEKNVASALKHLRKVSKRAEKRVSDAREKLGDSCTHPEKFVETYTWEHDMVAKITSKGCFVRFA